MTNIPTPPTAGVPLEAMSTGGAPLKYEKPDIAKLNPSEVAKTAKAVPEKKQAPQKETGKLSEKQEINKALQETAQMLLELKDARIELAALARLAGSDNVDMTAMGAELRSSIITNLTQDKTLEGPGMDTLKSLNVSRPETKATEKFLLDHAAQLPPEAVSKIQLEIKGGRMTMEQFSEMMQSYAPLREAYFTAILGEHIKPPGTAEELLAAAGLEATTKNLGLIKETFRPDKKLHIRGPIDKTLAIGLIFMLMSTSIQMVQESSGQQPQQHGMAHG